MEISMLQGEALARYWPRVSQVMDKVPHIWERTWTKESLCYALREGHVQLWAVGDEKEYKVLCFTQVTNYPSQRILEGLFILGRQLPKYLPLLAQTLEKFAIMQECTEFQMGGRPGWQKILAPLGVEVAGLLYKKRLDKRRTMH